MRLCAQCRAARDREKIRLDNQDWRRRNPEKRKAQKQRWKNSSREKIRAYKRDYDRNRRRTDLKEKLITTIRSRVATALRAARIRGRKVSERGALRFLGGTIHQLADHLQSQFRDGMAWENFGRGGWHIDHVFPVARADLTDPAELRAVFNWRNCRPEWESDNYHKNARVTPAARRLFDSLVAEFR